MPKKKKKKIEPVDKPDKVVEIIEDVHPKEVEKKEPIVKKTVEPPTGGWQHLLHDRKLIVLVCVAFGLFVTAGVVALVWKNNQTTTQPAKTSKKTVQVQEEVPLTQPRKIDGVVVATADANMVPACVMIENAAFSGVRPQAGLSAASVVYEIIVEGGITRLMAVYAGEQTDPVGPVRSSRDTYLEFASEYNCAYVHAGGSYTAQLAIDNLELRDIDALREYQWFWRDSNKYAPHNLFTNTENLYKAIAEGHSWKEAPTYTSWKFVDDTKLPTGEAATEVNIAFGGSYDVTYIYNTEGKYYERTNGGVLQTDSNTDATLTTRNIIVQHVPPGIFIEGKGRVNFSVTGEG
ncbi:MAG TPA: hypothetical protein DEG44_01080, partial [Candidatus Kerfeldbacteria bacterium]|nr:hypothetical protein [Candidatus Kerfeldbacteria bacterium]